ncbi:MAG: glycosidase, partial [bacterium]
MALASLTRTDTVIEPDRTRVLIRPHVIGNRERRTRIIARLLELSDSEVEDELDYVSTRFDARHPDFREVLLARFGSIAELVPTDRPLSESRKLLIGAAFMLEYSLEGAALFNPSIVPHPDQSGLAPGALRFILSLRATGEGHISSLVFREGEVDSQGGISIYPPTRFVSEGSATNNPMFDTELFRDKLKEIGDWNDTTKSVLEEVGEQFSLQEIQSVLYNTERSNRHMSDVEQGTI